MPVSRHDKRRKAKKLKQRRRYHQATLEKLEMRLTSHVKARILQGNTPTVLEWIKHYQRRIKFLRKLIQ